mmetsp:Transcript_26563/g.58212  ORF Transcript_26563/g.58212 Transcript_26563/m.58212 type:complete len:103 (+) Transcript_26563:1985-2293(+)
MHDVAALIGITNHVPPYFRLGRITTLMKMDWISSKASLLTKIPYFNTLDVLRGLGVVNNKVTTDFTLIGVTFCLKDDTAIQWSNLDRKVLMISHSNRLPYWF